MDNEFEKFHKKTEEENAKVKRDYKKVNVAKLKDQIWSGKRDKRNLSKTERYALSQDKEWVEDQRSISEQLYGNNEEEW